MPAQEGLKTEQLARTQVDNGLVLQDRLTSQDERLTVALPWLLVGTLFTHV